MTRKTTILPAAIINARTAGATAHADGVPKADNPFMPDAQPKQFRAWNDGWTFAQQKARK